MNGAKYTLVVRLDSGRRLFKRDGDDRTWLADESGATPADTDDGPMWLDATSPIEPGRLPVVLERSGEAGVISVHQRDAVLYAMHAPEMRHGFALDDRDGWWFR